MKMTVAKKMLLLTFVAIFGLAGLMTLNNYQMEKVYSETDFANTEVAPNIILLDKVRYDFNTLRIRLSNHTMNTDAAKMAEVEAAINKLQSQLNESLNAYETHIDSDEDKRMLAADRAGLEVYYERMQPILNASRQNKKDVARELFIAIREPAEKTNAAIAVHMSYNVKLGQEHSKEALAVKQNAAKTIRAIVNRLLATVAAGVYCCSSLKKEQVVQPGVRAEVNGRYRRSR